MISGIRFLLASLIVGQTMSGLAGFHLEGTVVMDILSVALGGAVLFAFHKEPDL